MIDRKDSRELAPTRKTPSTDLGKKTLSVKEMGAIAGIIKRSYESSPEFLEIMKTEIESARKIVEVIKSRELDDETIVNIIAIGRAELAMVTETDPLTDLPNRQAIERIMEEQVALARRNGVPITIAFIDLDEFKNINDRFTHDAGDAVLQGIGGFLKSELKRPTDKAGRWGGEEFIVVLPNTNENGAWQILDNLRKGMNKSVSEAVFQVGGYEFDDRKITASIGFISSQVDMNDTRSSEEIAGEFVSIADRRMLLAKGNGRNRVIGSQQEKDLTHQA